ncbi:HEPN domain-containing protein [Neomoorella mulderi]|uniref:HEPN domain protein n=1 Tax=Moorella mulderi DSM 14980 TaxID=1122241 RepID=A0A151AZC6_9FIRM|nr:HEPN domain-containing protein [Moorella mulderi]KYH32986.1 HEPN domain protein [Moorella mulderi DSM 14980]
MNVEERKQEALKWLKKAKGDLRVARLAFTDREGPEYGVACYLAQQCAEKSLKAFLISTGIEFAYKHDLEYLIELFPDEDKAAFAGIELEWLSDWVTEGRYPGDWPEATHEDAKKAIAMAEAIYNNIVEALETGEACK